MSQLGAPASSTLRLKQAEHILRIRLQHVLDDEHITFEQWQVLAALLEQPGLRMTDLAEAAVLPPATLTRHVDRLVERALVIRRIDPDDKRRVAVALSRGGELLATRLREIEPLADVALDDALPISAGRV